MRGKYRIHPNTCKCRGCRKKNKIRDKEERKVLTMLYGFFLVIISIGIAL